MSKYDKSVVILCEAGWRDIRELALELERQGVRSTVLIKGDPGREVKSFITERPLIRNYFFPRIIYRVRLPSFVWYLRFAHKAKVCVWTNPRSQRLLAPYCRMVGVRLVRFIEEGNKAPLDEMQKNIRNICSAIRELLSK
ncbi:MAG: hypothetical protein HY587_08260 [Candidatus Omnitrophica bacterium]|nr:hypothetical protein [Candidatus Omnitrophota bacterium]